MESSRDPAVYRVDVPVEVDRLGATRRQVDSWLLGMTVAEDVRDAVVWVVDAALSSAIDSRAHGLARGDDGAAEFCLHVDSDVVVLTATDHFEWSGETISTPGVLADQWRTLASFADQVALVDGNGPTTLTAVFTRRD